MRATTGICECFCKVSGAQLAEDPNFYTYFDYYWFKLALALVVIQMRKYLTVSVYFQKSNWVPQVLFSVP